MAIAYKSAGSGASTETSGAALQPTCPATVDANDILVAHILYEGTVDAPSTPSGWTLLDGPRTIESTVARHWVFGKIAAGTEDGASVSFGTAGGTSQRGGRIYSFSGYGSGTITQIVAGFAATSHATDPQMPSVTTTETGNLAVACVCQHDNNALAAATGESGGDWTEAVAEYVAALTPGLVLQLQTCTPTANPGTVSGGAVAATNDPSGVIGFQIKQTGVSTTPVAASVSLTLTPTVARVATFPRAVAATLTLAASVASARLTALAASVGLTLSPSVALVQIRGLAASVTLTLTPTASRVATFVQSAAATVTLAPTVAKTVRKELAASLTLAASVAKTVRKELALTLVLTPTVASAYTAVRSAATGLSLAASATHQFVAGGAVAAMRAAAKSVLDRLDRLGPPRP